MEDNAWIEQLAKWIDEKKDLPEELLELFKELQEKSATTESLVQSIRRLSQDLTQEHVLHDARRTSARR